MSRRGKHTAASSARSAERLASGSGGLQFVGFDALATDQGHVGFITPTAAADDSAISDPQAAVLVSGLSKKDPNTKYKSLIALQALVGKDGATADAGADGASAAVAAPSDTVLEILKHWPRLYRRLSIDPDRRVRAQSQHLMKALGVAAGKRISRQLSALMGPWLASQHDPAPDVAAAATAAFTTVFPKAEKRAKAVSVCFTSVTEHAYDYSSVQTVASLADSQSFTLDEHEKNELYTRAVSSALLALVQALGCVESPLPEVPALALLLENSKLWKAAGKPQTAATIRAATFDLLAAAVRCAPDLLKPTFKKSFGVACTALTDSDGSVQRAAWTALLHAANSAPDFWVTVNPRKTLWPAVWGLLRSGGGNGGGVIYASLPAFLGKVPQEVIGEGHDFHSALFKAILQGLESAPSGRVDREAMVRGAIEACTVLMAKASAAGAVGGDGCPLAFCANFASLLLHQAAVTLFIDNEVAVTFASRLLSRLVKSEGSERAGEALWKSTTLVCSEIFRSNSVVCHLGTGDHIVQCDMRSITNRLAVTAAPSAIEWVLAITSALATDEARDESKVLGLAHHLCVATLNAKTVPINDSVLWLQRLLSTISGSPVFSHGLNDGGETVASLLVWLNEPMLAGHLVGQAAVEATFLVLFSAVASGYVQASELAEKLEVIATTCSTLTAATAFFDACSHHALALKSVDRRKLAAYIDTIKELAKASMEKGNNESGVTTLFALATLADSLEYMPEAMYQEIVRALYHFVSSLPLRNEPTKSLPWFQSVSASRIPLLLRECIRCGGDAQDNCFAIITAFVHLCCDASCTDRDTLCNSLAQAREVEEAMSTVQKSEGVRRAVASGIARAVSQHSTPADPSSINTRSALVGAVVEVMNYDDAVCLAACPAYDIVETLFSKAVPRTGVSSTEIVSAGVVFGQSEVPHAAFKSTSETTRMWCSVVGFNIGLLENINLDKLACEEVVRCYAKSIYVVARTAASISYLNGAGAEWRENLTSGTSRLLSSIALKEALQAQSLAEAVIDITISSLNGDDVAVSSLLLVATVLPESGAGYLLKTIAAGQRCDSPRALWCAQALQVLMLRGGLDLPIVRNTIAHFEHSANDSFVSIASQLATATVALGLCLEADETRKSPPPSTSSAHAEEPQSAAELRARKALERATLSQNTTPDSTSGRALAMLTICKKLCDEDTAPHVLDEDVKSEVSSQVWNHHLDFCVSLARLFSIVVRFGDNLSTELWDFILCSTLAWLELDAMTVSEHAMVAMACQVLSATSDFFDNRVVEAIAAGAGPVDGSIVATVRGEWTDFFAPGAGEQLLRRLAASQSLSRTSHGEALLRQVARAALIVPPSVVVTNVDTATAIAMLGLVDSCPTACAVLHVLDCSVDSVEVPKELDDLDSFPCAAQLLEAWANAAVSVASDGVWRACVIVAATCKLLSRMSLQAKACIVAHIRSNRLMTPILDCCTAELPSLSRPLAEIVLQNSSLSFLRAMSLCAPEHQLVVFSTRIYSLVLRALPVLARDWFQDLSRQRATEVSGTTASLLSPMIIEDELKKVAQSPVDDEHLAVSVRKRAAEVVGTYSIDEMTMDLVVTFDKAHPLKPVEIGSNRRVGVSAAQWRTWLLQMTTYMTNQNGTVLDGFLVWKKNVDKRFEGVDDCMICYAVIHGTNYSLPNLKCRSCRNTFHSACLYKWFSTSQQSTCPLCRNLWVAQST